MEITKENVLDLVDYITHNNYFQNGRLYVDIEGERYSVEGIMKYISLCGFNL